MKKNTFKTLKKSMEEGLLISKGKSLKQTRISEYVIREPKDFTAKDIRQIREQLELSQPVFASLLAVTVNALRNWEQGRNAPSAIARRFLELIEEDPSGFINQAEEMEIIEQYEKLA